MFVVPDGFWTRDQKSCRNLPCVVVSRGTANDFMSLLFGGIEPETIVGLASFSDVPCPKESSPDPEPTSCLMLTSESFTDAPFPTSQSLQLEVLPSTARFAPLVPVSISNVLPVSTLGVEHGGVGTAPDATTNRTSVAAPTTAVVKDASDTRRHRLPFMNLLPLPKSRTATGADGSTAD